MTGTTIQYKGYTASVWYSEEEKCFIGDVIGIRHTIFFRGSTEEEVRLNFQEMIDDYPSTCAEQGIEPCKPPAKFTLSIPADLYAITHHRAEDQGVPVQNVMEKAIEQIVH